MSDVHELRDLLQFCFTQECGKKYFDEIVSNARYNFDINVYTYKRSLCCADLYQEINGETVWCIIGRYEEDMGKRYGLNITMEDNMGITYRYNPNFVCGKNAEIIHCKNGE
jgi:hypothetical protein